MKSKRRHRLTFPAHVLAGTTLVALFSSSSAVSAHAQTPQGRPAISRDARILLDRAHALEVLGKMDLAAQTWQQVLLADPNNPEALGGLARAAKQAGNDTLSNSYLQQLRAVSPNDPSIARAEQTQTRQNQAEELRQAGKLAQAGQYTQAMEVYRRVFGDTPPPGEWSLAYYETESATDDGHAHAIAGLRSLVNRYPQDSRYQIALGRILTYTPATRPEGRRLLARHPSDPQANAALRQSLVWDSENPASAAEIRAYLATHPDSQLSQALHTQASETPARRSTAPPASTAANSTSFYVTKNGSKRIRQPAATDAGTGSLGLGQSNANGSVEALPLERSSSAAGERLALAQQEDSAYRALNTHQTAAAEVLFKAILDRDPHNARALAGLGYARMQQSNFAGAISFLEQAKQDGSNDKGIELTLTAARFYSVMSDATTALNENDLPTAEQLFQRALSMRVNSPDALQGLGGTLLKAQQPEAAIKVFERYTRVKPDATAAWRGLLLAEYQAGQAAQALLTERLIPSAVRTQLLRDPDYLRTLASAYQASGRDADAQRVLRSALDLPFPVGARGLKAETQLQYAALLQQANRLDQAAGLYRQVLADDPSNTDAFQGLVRVEHAMNQDQQALATIESMPPASYQAAMRDPGFETTVAAIYQDQNKLEVAEDILERAISQQTASGQQPSVPVELQLAGIYLARNRPSLAYPIYRRVLGGNPDRGDAWKGLLSALHATGRDQEVISQVQQIPPAVRRQLESDPAYLQTLASTYVSAGNTRQAQVLLNRIQQHYAQQRVSAPADVDLQDAYLLFNSMNDAGLYRQLLNLGARTDLTDDQRRTVQTIWTLFAVRRANQAAAAGNLRRSLAILNAAARAFPDNPAVQRALAAGYATDGLPKEALRIYKSQDMSSGTAGDYKSAIGAALADNDKKDAETYLRFGLVQYPRDAQMLLLGARFEQLRGDNGRAATYYKASLAALPPSDPGAELAQALSRPLPAAEVRQPTPDLAQLLAPGANDSAIISGSIDAEAPPKPSRPYLPSPDNIYGTAPVQLNRNNGLGSDYDGSYPAVPSYMANPGPPHSTLGSYTPPESEVYPPVIPDRTTPAAAKLVSQGSSFSAASARPRSFTPSAIPNRDAFRRQQITRVTEQAGSSLAAAPEGEEVFLPYTGPRLEDGAKSAKGYRALGPGPLTSSPQQASAGGTTGLAAGTLAGSSAASTSGAQGTPPGTSGTRGDSRPPTKDFATEPPQVLTHNAQYSPAQAQNDAQTLQPQRNSARATPGSKPPSASPALRGQAFPGQPIGSDQTEVPIQPAATTSEGGVRQRKNPGTPIPSSKTSPPRQTGDSYGQQYPQPATAPQGSTRAVPRRPASASQGSAQSDSQRPALTYPAIATPLSNQAGPPLPGAYPQPPVPTDQDLVNRNVPPLRGYYNPTDRPSPRDPLSPREQTELALASLDGASSGWAGGEVLARYRSGTPGVDRLTDIEAPFEASVVAGRQVRFTIIPRGVFLYSGSFQTGATNGPTPILGTLPANAVVSPQQQYAAGVGGEIQLTTKNLGLAAGYTPYQFLVSNITGRFSWTPAGGPFSIFGERQPVKETQLSYAGLIDPGSVTPTSSGNIWGGVVSSTGGIRIDFGNARAGFYASLDGGVLTGFHVLENFKVEGNGGAYFRVHEFPHVGRLQIGGNFFGEHYDRNELGETFGLGGYFSPQAYFLAAVPVTFYGHYLDLIHYDVSGSVGIQTFEQNAQIYYPLDPVLETASGLSSSSLVSNTGVNYSFQGEGAYRFDEHWFLGASLSANNTNNYNTVTGGFFVRYVFKPQVSSEEYPTGIFAVEGFRPLRVP